MTTLPLACPSCADSGTWLVSGTAQTWTDPDGRAVALVGGQCRRCGSLVLLDPSAEALAQIRVRIAGRRREAA